MQALIDIFLQCIIHKAMARNAGYTSEDVTLNAYPKVRAKAAVIGAYVPCMRRTFINDFNKIRA